MKRKHVLLCAVLCAAASHAWADDDVPSIMLYATPAGRQAMSNKTEYFELKKLAKAQHPTWDSDQAARYAACRIGFRVAVTGLIEADERDDTMKKALDLCVLYAPATPQ
jgi:hypothetical protein